MIRFLSILLLAFLCTSVMAQRLQRQDDETITIAHKDSTESRILGEIIFSIARHTGNKVGYRVRVKDSHELWKNLLNKTIDIYPEYSGTLAYEILGTYNADFEVLQAALQPYDLEITNALGFNNTYALGMRAAHAQKLGITKISDLQNHPDLQFGMTNEFILRLDGWTGLRTLYHLPQDILGMRHDVAYRHLNEKTLDVIDVYSTDPEIIQDDILMLEDDKNYFPAYEALYLYRSDLKLRAANFVAALNNIAGRIDQETIQNMNYEVQLGGKEVASVVSALLNIDMPDVSQDMPHLWQHTYEHLTFAGIFFILALLAGFLMGAIVIRQPHFGHWILRAIDICQA